MATPARRLIAPFLLAASFAHSALGQVPGRDVVGPARDLYASARYDEALAVLNDLRPADSGTTVSDRKSIEQYRSLCLLALGRGTEAESAIAAVVTADPAYQPGEVEASPRVRAAFSDVRRRLVTGFLDLSVAASAPAPAPAPPKPAPAPAAPAVPQPDPNRIYSMQDKEVTAPVVIRQRMPQLTPSMKSQAKDRGIVEVVIDELGRVTNVTVRESIHPMFDAELLTAGREWRYQPATFAGKPVRYRKMIQINVTAQ